MNKLKVDKEKLKKLEDKNRNEFVNSTSNYLNLVAFKSIILDINGNLAYYEYRKTIPKDCKSVSKTPPMHVMHDFTMHIYNGKLNKWIEVCANYQGNETAKVYDIESIFKSIKFSENTEVKGANKFNIYQIGALKIKLPNGWTHIANNIAEKVLNNGNDQEFVFLANKYVSSREYADASFAITAKENDDFFTDKEIEAMDKNKLSMLTEIDRKTFNDIKAKSNKDMELYSIETIKELIDGKNAICSVRNEKNVGINKFNKVCLMLNPDSNKVLKIEFSANNKNDLISGDEIIHNISFIKK